MSRRLVVESESWPLKSAFKISRGAKTTAEVVVVRLEEEGVSGWGECVPYGRYGESIESVIAQIEAIRTDIENELGRVALQTAMPAGAARNAVDCALWDLDAKKAGTTVWSLMGVDKPPAKETLFTISLGTAAEMAAATRAANHHKCLKIKLGEDDAGIEQERLAAVREAAPGTILVADANEGWSFETLKKMAPHCEKHRVAFIEQPIPAADDGVLAGFECGVRLLADESLHQRDELERVAQKYQAVNVKLDKAGGLTEGLALAKAATEAGLAVVIGCMVSTSLSMAPAFALSSFAELIDLDGPLLLAKDRPHGIRYDGGLMHPSEAALWG